VRPSPQIPQSILETQEHSWPVAAIQQVVSLPGMADPGHGLCGARSVPVFDVEPLSDGDASGLQVKPKGDIGGAGRRLGALRAPILVLHHLDVVGSRRRKELKPREGGVAPLRFQEMGEGPG
jgi:hypothetical protein